MPAALNPARFHLNFPLVFRGAILGCILVALDALLHYSRVGHGPAEIAGSEFESQQFPDTDSDFRHLQHLPFQSELIISLAEHLFHKKKRAWLS
jgi:hypothetical protein